MAEIDNIIIESLKNLHCQLEEDITSLKQFEATLSVLAISTCLEAIIPGTTFPKKLPPSMSIKLKIASNLAQQIKDLGFRGDMGYQTILYCNEVEIRRVLMFLIERLPRESNKIVPIEEIGYVPQLIKEIEEKIHLSLKQMWLPSSVLKRGCRKLNKTFVVNSLGGSCPLQTDSLVIPNTRCIHPIEDEAAKQYYIRIVPDVTKQCSQRKLLPSLLFKDNEMNIENSYLVKIKSRNIFKISTDVDINHSKLINDSEDKLTEENIDKIQLLIKQVADEKLKYTVLQDIVRNCELQLSQTDKVKSEEQELLKTTLSRIKIKSKTLAVLSKEENILKLKNLVENGSDRLIDLTNQWNQVQTPLLEQYKSLQNIVTNEELKLQQEQMKIKKLHESYSNLETDFKEKELLEQQLKQKCEQINKNHNRSGYTRRILEIIGNIKKQNDEIQKVLKDTRQVQKDINSLTGQVDRSFTLSDELIFRDAKHDETARKTYKLLASLRDECSNIIKAVTDLGLAERESRNLQEQLDTEKAKEIGVKLERVEKDLKEVIKDTKMLLEKD